MRNPLYRLLLIDNDLVFRLGLRTWLEQFADLTISAEADTVELALSLLAGNAPASENIPEEINPSIHRQPNCDIDLVIMGLSLGQNERDRWSGLEFCRQLKSRYPTLPILLLSAPQDPARVAMALHSGVEGYCLKGSSSTELLAAIRQVAAGQPYLSDRNLAIPEGAARIVDEPSSVFALLKRNLYRSGLHQIESALAQISTQLESTGTSTADLIAKAVLAGQVRELSAARWCLNQLWGPRRSQQLGQTSTTMAPPNNRLRTFANNTGKIMQPAGRNPALAAQEGSDNLHLTAIMAIQWSLIDATVAKLQDNLSNFTTTPLEIDILRDEKKRELLHIILRQLENTLSELRFSQTQPTQLIEKKSVILQDLWRNATITFLGKYYTLAVKGKADISIVEVLLQEVKAVETSILGKIPQVEELLSHLLFQTALTVDNHTYGFGTPEAMQRMVILLDNLLIQVANAVIQPLLNHFADIEDIKQRFYPNSLIASREIERFRNDLSWKYRIEQYVTEPQAIFESRYILFILANPGIKKIDIYAPRNQELQQLSGIRLLVTLVLELQDAILPRLRSILSVLGSGVVYVLTNILGRGLGLVARGVLQGMGSAWQEGRLRQKERLP